MHRIEPERGHAGSGAREGLEKTDALDAVEDKGKGDDENGEIKTEQEENGGRTLRGEQPVEGEIVRAPPGDRLENPLGHGVYGE